MQNCGKAWKEEFEEGFSHYCYTVLSKFVRQDTYSNIKSENPVIYKFL